MEVDPATSTNIRRIKAEFQKDKEDRSRKKPTDKTLVVDVWVPKSTFAYMGPKVDITSLFPTLNSSLTPIPTIGA